MQIGEWAAAVTCWVLLACLGFARQMGWWGDPRKNEHVLLKIIQAVLVLLICVLLITITDLRKPDNEPWSNLQKLWLHKAQVRTEPQPMSPTRSQVSLYLGCDWSQIPIHIAANSVVHVLRIYPDILNGNPVMIGRGAIEDVVSDRDMTWPSKSDGRWMTLQERHKAVVDGNGLATAFAFNCTLKNYGHDTLEDIVGQLIIDTSDKKRHTYPISFDPLMLGGSFSFYVVNVCSSGITPELVQWGEVASVHVSGEKSDRTVPLKFEKRNWPTVLAPVFGPSSFLWSGMQSCQWDKPK